MALVTYSDSEGSASAGEIPKSRSTPTALSNAQSKLQPDFSVDKSHPRKIKVKLATANALEITHNEEPPAKKARLGDGGLVGFNAMLPPPKRDKQATNDFTNGVKKERKVFSLRTSAEPAFSRDAYIQSDEWDYGGSRNDGNGAEPLAALDPPKKGNAMLFKPLSVSRKPQKRRPLMSSQTPASHDSGPRAAIEAHVAVTKPESAKISLFSAHSEVDGVDADVVDDDAAPDPAAGNIDKPQYEFDIDTLPLEANLESQAAAESLEQVAMDLNLSGADRRQLLGRNGKTSANAINVVNFNTDNEYAANEEFRASGEQVQHNPVRAIAPGKHSLKQLVSAASGQKDALEESFATGKRNKKEAGSRYGW